MINFQRIELKFSQLNKHLLFDIPYKICKHSFKSIDFTASVYELFDNPSYMNICYLAEIQKMPQRFYNDCSPTNTTHYICYHTGRTAVHDKTNMNSYFPAFESRNKLSITIFIKTKQLYISIYK